MESKREYLSPEIKVVKFTSCQLLEATGVLEIYESKKTDLVEEETGIPDNFSNIWGDEDED